MEWDLGLCTVRSWRWGDEESLVRHANDREVWINLRDRFPHPYTREDAKAWLFLAGAQDPETNFAIAIGDEAVGGIGLTLNDDVFRRSAEIGYWLGRAYWGRGIATAAVRTITDFAFAHFDLCRIYAGVFAWNPASMRVLEKAGYTLEGRLRKSVTKDGKTIDRFLYAIIRES
ncbi:MAG: GNAT family N-acetyltransferase [Isosphaeraceae bacterium]|nr:GNAT family N-acetyltransferase [Isosphaeraceae bacterium]